MKTMRTVNDLRPMFEKIRYSGIPITINFENDVIQDLLVEMDLLSFPRSVFYKRIAELEARDARGFWRRLFNMVPKKRRAV